jgi:hypothetical protein
MWQAYMADDVAYDKDDVVGDVAVRFRHVDQLDVDTWQFVGK